MGKPSKSFGSVAFVTMGCAKNEVDSAEMAERLLDAGYEISDDLEDADVIVVNTCSFIQAATEESIDAVLEVAGLNNVSKGDSHLVVAGCMPARYGVELEEELPEAAAFVPCSKEDDIVAIIDGLLGTRSASLSEPETVVPGLATGDVANSIVPGKAPYAYVKISDGCDRFCAYCTIPFIRGRYHSFTQEQIFSDIARMVSRGAREIVFIAQDTGRWGQDFEEPRTLASLLAAAAGTWPETWFRVMYIQPEGITDELIGVVSGHENICSYFDIPFQHCNERILKKMNRKGSGSEFLQLINHIRERIENVTLRTTLIAGFPGESEDDFEELCEFVEEAALDYVGVFPYSREEGTQAYNLTDQVDDDEKFERAQQLRDIADAVSAPVIAARIGRTMDVLVCGAEEDGQLYGRAMCQAPDVDGVTYLDNGEVGDIQRVVIEGTLLYEMEGSEQA